MIHYKRPESVLVLIHTPDLQVLLLERAAHPGYWQSVTGSQEADESLAATAVREVAEETGILARPEELQDWQITNHYEIFAEWRHRYAPGVLHNTEHVFSLQVPAVCQVTIAPGEHREYCWLPWGEAAAKCFSWSNRDAILILPERLAGR
ncbi:MAG TPA: dihydroneopterin triphosphate diphosphatase [Accumulibacter sp.]|uniref:dihydroneopterin triphosphate diphosphatase n=1 Tax=Accumulibacter sp. TaxID=2053492 RepID=UPI0025F89E13|nr:dihydroneopterin triphosphate diphosphatase [Accumulibacter sp.]MCM8598124.1 dihydroneopterin triphosphate diphosphatase [Accumulibacter sp.]MCM8662289.1 dihydroneopterin triphosphate diphosphatase [Accumulibacter sp.]HNC52462.1 dihydroneopterin triphosphate diphosphatase [Accumulibacter sp.]